MRHPPGRKWLKDLRACLCLIACLLAWNPSAARSQDEERAEYTLKLAFLYNFTKFVEWPADTYPDAGSPLAICIVGEDPFNPDMEADLRTRTSGGHPVDVRTLHPNDMLKECQLVFVPAKEKKLAARIVSELNGLSTLTVGETEGFASIGGIINLTVEEDKLRFQVNPLAAEHARLKLSSKLLSMAIIVTTQDHKRKS